MSDESRRLAVLDDAIRTVAGYRERIADILPILRVQQQCGRVSESLVRIAESRLDSLRAELSDQLFVAPPEIKEEMMPAITLPDGRLFGPPLRSPDCHVGIVGVTGGGKTTIMKRMLASVATWARVILFDRKRELRHLAGFPEYGKHWTVLTIDQLPLALTQPPSGLNTDAWSITLVDMLARGYSLYASQRPALDLLRKAYRTYGGATNLHAWLEMVQAWNTGRNWREEGNKQALEWVLVNLLESAPFLNHAESNALEILSTTTGGLVIEAGNLPVAHYSFYAGYIVRWTFERRMQGHEHG